MVNKRNDLDDNAEVSPPGPVRDPRVTHDYFPLTAADNRSFFSETDNSLPTETQRSDV